MREIKFRGKFVGTGDWVYGESIRKRHTNDVVMIQDDKGLGCDVCPDTVGQYTGLHDLNGNEIYEGDIIVVKELHDGDEDCWNDNERRPIPQVVAWDEGSKSFNFGGCYRITKSPRHFAVIGNIHDNPELL